MATTQALKTPHMIGRENRLQEVKLAIAPDKSDTHVFYIEGKGGIGKTRFLEEVGVWLQKQQEKGERLVWSGIIDLYNPDMHSSSRIEEEIVQALDPHGNHFFTYRLQREQFEEQRFAGLGGKALEKARKRLTATFIEDFARLAAARRVVLAVDTLETVQYESNVVQEIAGIADRASSVRNWFLQVICNLPNTVTLFAGRPRPRLLADFQARLQQDACRFHHFSLSRLTKEEAQTYLEAMAKQAQEVEIALEKRVFPHVYVGSGGRPIYLSLVADLLVSGLPISDVIRLREDPHQDEESYRERMQQRIATRLGELPEPDGIILKLLPYARQGLNPSLLLYLLSNQWSGREANEAIEGMRRYTFIKTHRGDPHTLFLHDEIYDLLERYFLADPVEAKSKFEEIAAFYRKRYEDIYARRRMFAREARRLIPGPEQEKLYQQMDELEATLWELTPYHIYYGLQITPKKAYFYHFLDATSRAIKSQQTGHDMRLRDTLFNFIEQIGLRPARDTGIVDTPRHRQLLRQLDLAVINRQSALHWIRRYLQRAEWADASRIARKFRESKHEHFDWDEIDDPLYRAELLILWAEALLYQNVTQEERLDKLEKAVHILEELNLPEQSEPDPEDWRWRRANLLGRAYNHIGFAYRTQDQLRAAIDSYLQAIAWYRTIDIKDEIANTEANLAYLYARLGALYRAESLARGALKLRRQLRRRYPLAFSYNVLGRVFTDKHQFADGIAYSKRALALFSQFTSEKETDMPAHPYGRALAHYYIGNFYRRWANNSDPEIISAEEIEKRYKEASHHLHEAEKYFEGSAGRDNIYALVCQGVLGSLYRDLVRFYREQGNESEVPRNKITAQFYLDSALERTKVRNRPDLQAHLLENQARLYWYLGDKQTAKNMLDQADSLIPDEYRPRPNDGFADIEKAVDTYWLTLGKIHLLRGTMLFDPAAQQGALTEGQVEQLMKRVREQLLAYACIEQFSGFPLNPATEHFFDALYKSLKRYKAERLQRALTVAKDLEEGYGLDLKEARLFLQETVLGGDVEEDERGWQR